MSRTKALAVMGIAVVAALAAIVVPTATASGAQLACAPVYVAPPPTPRFTPPLVSGDREFAGHGPAITVWAKRMKWDSTRDSLTVVVRMRAEETQSNWSKAAGTRTYTLYTAPAGCNIDARSLAYGSFDSNGYLARSSYPNPYPLPAGDTATVNKSFVSGYTVWDDRVGADVGYYTSVVVKFRPFTVRFTN